MRLRAGVILILSLVFCLRVNAKEISLPGKGKEIYTSLGSRLYDLKVKMKPKIVKEKVYWQDRKDIDWKKEIKNWKFGFVPRNETLFPIVIYKENFYPLEEKYQGRFRWMSNNARLLVLNPLETPVKASFIFEALSFKKERKLEIWINGEKVSSVEVPEDKERNEFKKFVIKDFVLNPGKNRILFYTPDGTDTLKPKKWEKDKEREVSIKFKNFSFQVKNKLELFKKQKKVLPQYSYVITNEGLNLRVYFRKEGQGFLLISRDTNINLEEYLCFDLDCALKGNNANLEVFFGIDYNGDGHIEGYLNPKSLKEINLLEMAKDKWQDVNYFKYGFKLRKIIFVLSKKEGDLSLRFRGFKVYSLNSSIRLPIWKANKSILVVKQVKNLKLKSNSNGDKTLLVISTYFDSKNIGTEVKIIKQRVRFILKNGTTLTGEIESENNEEFKLSNVRELQGEDVVIKKDSISYYYYLPRQVERRKVLEDEYVAIEIPVKLKDRIVSPYLILTYKLEKSNIQEVELFFDVDNDGDGKIDERVMAGRKEIIKDFQFVGTQGNMDLYEAYLSNEFPSIYKSTGATKTRFIIYKNDKPLKLTWKKWFADTELAEVGVLPRRVVISLPQRKIPKAVYSIFYWPQPKPSQIYKDYQELGIPMDIDLSKIKKVVLKLKRKKEIEAEGWFKFCIKELGIYKKFPYPLKEEKLTEEFLSLIKEVNFKLVKIDGEDYYLNDFKNWHSFKDLEKDVLVKSIRLMRGNHTYKKYKNSTFEVKWTILEPAENNLKENIVQPQITFKKINPTKYLIKIEGAKNPFWLVFSESFHKQWRLYKLEKNNPQNWKGIVADYSHLKVKEAKHLMKFTPQDIKYLFKKPLSASHLLVNGYANGWFIEPKKLGLGENFILVIYFWPQSLFYSGLAISGITFLFCIIYLLVSWIKRNKACKEKSI